MRHPVVSIQHNIRLLICFSNNDNIIITITTIIIGVCQPFCSPEGEKLLPLRICFRSLEHCWLARSKPGSGPGLGLSYLRNFLRYCRLHEDHENTPLLPVSVGDMMLPSAFLQGLPSPSWIMPKLRHSNKRDRIASVNPPRPPSPTSPIITGGRKWCAENQQAQVRGRAIRTERRGKDKNELPHEVLWNLWGRF